MKYRTCGILIHPLPIALPRIHSRRDGRRARIPEETIGDCRRENRVTEVLGEKTIARRPSREKCPSGDMIPAVVATAMEGCRMLRLQSADGTNRLTCACVMGLTDQVRKLAAEPSPTPVVITGNARFFSTGADLEEIVRLNAPAAFEFSKMGQELMRLLSEFPAPLYAAISGYCMGGGLDLALACRHRICSPNAIFGHRGAALGLLTGWGGTQRLPRLVGRARALQMFVTAEKLDAARALQIGLVDAIADDPVAEASHQITSHGRHCV